MGHRRVARHHHVVDHAVRHVVLVRQLGQHAADAPDGQVLEFLEAVLLRGVDDARDDVVAALYLRVVRRCHAEDVAVRHVHEVHDDGGGADVHGRAVAGLSRVAGIDVQDLGKAAHVEDRDRHLPVRLADYLRHLFERENVEVEMRGVEPLLVQGAPEPLVIRDVVIDGRGGHLEVHALIAGLEAPAGLLHELEELVGLRARGDLVLCLHARLGRDFHHEVAHDLRVAGEDVAPLPLLGGEVRCRLPGLDCPFLDDHLALSAVALPAAG